MWDWEGGIATEPEPRALDTIAAFTVGPLVSGRVSGDGAVVGPTSGYRPLWDRGFLLHRQGTGGESGSHLCICVLTRCPSEQACVLIIRGEAGGRGWVWWLGSGCGGCWLYVR